MPPRANVPEIRAGEVQLPVEVTVTLPPRVSVPAPVVTWFTLPATPPVPPRFRAPMVSLNPLRLRIALPVLVALTVTAPVPGRTLDAPKVRVPKLMLVPPVYALPVALRVRVPVPSFCNTLAPEPPFTRAALMSVFPVPVMVRVRAAVLLAGAKLKVVPLKVRTDGVTMLLVIWRLPSTELVAIPENVRLLVPDVVRFCPRLKALAMALAPDRSALASMVDAPPASVRLPVLRAVALPRIRVPSLNVVFPVKVLGALIAIRPLVTPQAPDSSLSARLPVPVKPVPLMVSRESASPPVTVKLALPLRLTPPLKIRLLATSSILKRATLVPPKLTNPDWVTV